MIKEKLIIECVKVIEVELKKELNLNANEIEYIQKELTNFNAILELIKGDIK
jgi:hypothetical protein